MEFILFEPLYFPDMVTTFNTKNDLKRRNINHE